MAKGVMKDVMTFISCHSLGIHGTVDFMHPLFNPSKCDPITRFSSTPASRQKGYTYMFCYKISGTLV